MKANVRYAEKSADESKSVRTSGPPHPSAVSTVSVSQMIRNLMCICCPTLAMRPFAGRMRGQHILNTNVCKLSSCQGRDNRNILHFAARDGPQSYLQVHSNVPR